MDKKLTDEEVADKLADLGRQYSDPAALGGSWFGAGAILSNDEIPGAALNVATQVWEANEKQRLRDKFAMAALTGLLADPNTLLSIGAFARTCYDYADAMLEAREKK